MAIGAVEVLRLITKGPGPPRRTASGKGTNKSSMVRCQISPVIGDFIGAAMNVFSTNGWRVVTIVSKQAWLSRDRRLLAATNLIYVKMNTSGTVTSSRYVRKSHALCLLLATERARVGECLMLRWRRRNLSRRPTPEMMDTFDVLLVDLRDVSCRIYTFVTTLRYVLEVAAGKTFCALALRRETARTPAGRYACVSPVLCTVRKTRFDPPR